MNLTELGSKTAKDGFNNEYFVVSIFNDWKNNELAKNWLKAMGYKIDEIEEVNAYKIKDGLNHIKSYGLYQIMYILLYSILLVKWNLK